MLFFTLRKKRFDEMDYSVTGMFNINDKSYSLSPELLYTGITNLELRLITAFLSGQRDSEYGEKLNDYKVEVRGRYYF